MQLSSALNVPLTPNSVFKQINCIKCTSGLIPGIDYPTETHRDPQRPIVLELGQYVWAEVGGSLQITEPQNGLIWKGP